MINNACLISVIMPVYNTEPFLCTAIESVLNQSHSNWELIVIDDGSTDNGGKICDKYADLDPRITVRHTRNRGVDSSRNLGIDLARGDWITFLDSDDQLATDALNILAAHAENCDTVIAGYRETPGVKRYHAVTAPKRIDRLNESVEEFIRIDRSFVLSGLHAKLFRKSAIKRRFREDQPFADDTFFNIDNLFDANGIVFLPDFLYVYRRRSDSGALHNTQDGRLETSFALMRTVLDAFPDSDELKNHLTGKMIIRIHNHLARLLSHKKETAERTLVIREMLKKPLFHDKLLLTAKAPLPELDVFWSALLAGDAEAISDFFTADSRTVRSDSPGMISVIVPVYNMMHTLPAAIDSILAQTYTHWELVIVDDGSTDGSGALADAYMERDARILVLHQENAGVSAGRNTAMRAACGEWIAFLDADDVYLPESFAQMIEQSENADLVACGTYLEKTALYCQPWSEVKAFDSLPEGEDLDILWANCVIPVVWAKIFRRQKIRELFATDLNYGEDTLFNLRVFPTLGRIVIIPQIGYLYTRSRERLDRGMLEGSRRQFFEASELLPDNEVILRRTYIAFIRQVRRFALNIVDSKELSSEEKEDALVFCGRLAQLPEGMDHEEYLFPVNLEWWRQLKAGQYEKAVAGLRVILEERRKKLDVLYPNGRSYTPRG